MAGDKPGLSGSCRDGFKPFDRARSEHKDTLVMPGPTHYALYDLAAYVAQAIMDFWQEYSLVTCMP
ncbi:hypothetical protein CFR73_11215 [Novacetimonas maltaceti]|nr:hypothetical protein CFR73_11215 [Novacetimonas maltaceti]